MICTRNDKPSLHQNKKATASGKTQGIQRRRAGREEDEMKEKFYKRNHPFPVPSSYLWLCTAGCDISR